MIKVCLLAMVVGSVLVTHAAPNDMGETLASSIKVRDNIVWIGYDKTIIISKEPKNVNYPAMLIDRQKNSKIIPMNCPPNSNFLNKVHRINAPKGEIFNIKTSFIDSVDRNGNKRMRIEVNKFNQKTWQWELKPHGVLVHDQYFRTFMISEQYLLGIASKPGTFQVQSKNYLFAVFKLNDKGQYLYDHYENDGFAADTLVKDGKWRYKVLNSLWLNSEPVWTNDSTLITSGCGIYWSFDHQGKFIKLLKLYDEYSNNYLEENNPWHGMQLGYQPNAFGQIIVSCLSVEAASLWQTLEGQYKQPVDVKAYDAMISSKINYICNKFPNIQWFTLDPKSGTKARITAPVNVPTRVNRFEDYMDFNWIFNPDGNLLFYQN